MRIARFDKYLLSDIELPSYQEEVNVKGHQMFTEVVEQVKATYPNVALTTEGKNVQVFSDGEHIGVIETNLGYDGDDFANKRFTVRVCFTPNVEVKRIIPSML